MRGQLGQIRVFKSKAEKDQEIESYEHVGEGTEKKKHRIADSETGGRKIEEQDTSK